MASGRIRPDPAAAETEAMSLGRLRSDAYLDRNLDCPGVLRHAEVGDGTGASPGAYRAQDVYASWGD